MQEATDTAPKNQVIESPPESAEPRPDLQIETASLSDVGRMRTENQDACGETFDPQGNRLLIVADGMGGHAGGSTASRICIETACREFRDSSAQLDERLRLAIQQANADVFEVAGENPELAGMGTTAVAMALKPNGEAWVAWVGDSRAYRMRSGELTPITDDHSWVAEAVRVGAIAPEEAETHPRKNQRLRSVGADPNVDVDVRPVEVRAGDRYMICSDGLWGEVPPPEIAAVLGYESPASATRKLVDRANEHGGPDNITVQILAIGENEALAAAAPAGDPQRAGLPRGLIAAAGVVALCLLGLGWYAVEYGGGGFPERHVAAPEPPPPVEAPGAAALAAPETEAAEETGPTAQAEPEEPAEPLEGAVPTGEPPRGSLAQVASGTLAEPEPFPAPPRAAPRSAAQIEDDVEGFLGSWSRSVMDKDWASYNRIGLPASREQFERDYAEREDLQMGFELLESSVQPNGSIKARVRMDYGYVTPMGRRELQTEYRIRLRRTPQGLRYGGGWN